MTHLGSCITARGVGPMVPYQHKYATTYLYGSYSPMDGDSFVWEINGVDCKIFEACLCLKAFSEYKPDQTKILVIDNAGFHSTKNINVPKNIILPRIPPYCPELNPCEQIWAWIKNRYKNQLFENIENLRSWLHSIVKNMDACLIKSIVSNHNYLNNFNAAFSN